MRWSNQPFVPTSIDRVRLRRAALRYVEHGWPVTPGACLAGNRFACGRAGCPTTGCHPALQEWERAASTDVSRVAAWWRHRPHTVLLATGVAFDVLEVPASLGLRAVTAARRYADVVGPALRGPVGVTEGRFMFLVGTGATLRPELLRCPDVVRHGRGSWIPVAPSRTPDGPVRWAVSPEETRWLLPEPLAVQAMIIDALGAPGGRRRRGAGPRSALPTGHAA